MIDQRLNTLEQTVVRMETKVDGIAETLQSLARIEERQMATNERLRKGDEAIADLDDRLRKVELAIPENLGKRLNDIEVEMPGLKESRRWVVSGVLAGVGMIGVAVVHIVLK